MLQILLQELLLNVDPICPFHSFFVVTIPIEMISKSYHSGGKGKFKTKPLAVVGTELKVTFDFFSFLLFDDVLPNKSSD